MRIPGPGVFIPDPVDDDGFWGCFIGAIIVLIVFGFVSAIIIVLLPYIVMFVIGALIIAFIAWCYYHAFRFAGNHWAWRVGLIGSILLLLFALYSYRFDPACLIDPRRVYVPEGCPQWLYPWLSWGSR